MIILCINLLPNDRMHAIPADFGTIFELKPVIDKVIEVHVAPIITVVTNDSIIVFRLL